MIVETIVDIFFNSLLGFFNGLELIGLPFQLINTLSTILVYGVWIVGADIMALFISMVVSWWVIKLTIGLVLWIWELLPLT